LPLLQVILTASVGCLRWILAQAADRSDALKPGMDIISQLRDNDWGIEEITERYLYKSEVQVHHQGRVAAHPWLQRSVGDV
jgi:hypothetical protein